MADPDTAQVHQCQQQVKAAQEKGDKDAELKAWNELGKLRLQQGQYPESIECYQNLARVAKQLKNSVSEGRAYYNIALAYSSLNRYAESVEYYHKCIDTLEGQGDDKTIRMAYCNLGIVYYKLEHYIEAIKYSETGLKMAETAGDKNVEIRCCHKLATSNQASGYYEKSIVYFERTLVLFQQTGDFPEPVENIECNLGNAFHACGKYEEALKHHKQSLEYAIQNDNKSMQKHVYMRLGMDSNSSNDYPKAAEYFEKYQNIAMITGDKKGEVDGYRFTGLALMEINNHEAALECFQNSLRIAIEIQDKQGEGYGYNNIGLAYSNLGKYQHAIEYFEKNLAHSIEEGDRKMEGDNHRNIGNAYLDLGKNETALECFQTSLRIAIEIQDKEGEEYGYGNVAAAYNKLGKYQQSIEYLEKSLVYSIDRKDRIRECTICENIGGAYSDLENYEAALESYQNSLRIAIEIQDKIGQEYGYCNVGIVYNKLGKYQLAIENFENSLVFAIERKDCKRESQAYMSIGKAYISLEQPQKAIECLNKSLVISKEIVDVDEEKFANRYIGEAQFNLGNYKEALENYQRCHSLSIQTGDKPNEENANSRLGVIYGNLHYYDKAIECFEKELSTVVEKGEKPAARVWANLARVYTSVARYDEAFAILEKGLRSAEEEGDTDLQSTIHTNMAATHNELGNREEEIKHRKLSAELALKSGNRSKKIIAYRTLLTIEKESQNYKTMLEYAEKHFAIAKNSSDKSEQLFAYYDMGRACYFLGIYQDAKKFLLKSIEIAVDNGNKEAEASSYGYLGFVYQHENSPDTIDKAFQYFEKQLELGTDINKRRVIGNAYSNLGNLSFSLYLKDKSTEHKEQAEHYLKESLRSYNAFLDNVGDQDERKINVIETFVYVLKKLVELHIKAGELKEALLVAEQEQGRALEDILQRRYILGDAKKLRYSFLEYNDIERKVLTSDTSILFYSNMRSSANYEIQLGTWVLDIKNHVSFHRNELQSIKDISKGNESLKGTDLLSEFVDNLVNSSQRSTNCEDRSFSIHGNPTPGRSASQSERRCVFDEKFNEDYLALLYDILITPVQDKLIHEEIVIVPNGPLFRVPFAALRNPQTESFLVETKRVRIVPSLTTLKILKESSAESHSLKGALIVGNPDVGDKRILRGKERSFHSLPNAQREAEEISKVLGVKALTGKQASKQVIIERLRQGVAVIHFAAHGCAETGEIILAPPEDHPADKIPDEEDYLLTISEVQQTGLRARLVVLSCCHSGRGEIKSEGVIGMSRAFLAAGALAVVATLWAVDDKGTRVFMELFYSHLKQGKTACVSLQQAMKDMRTITDYKKPMFWAPFVLIGDDVTITEIDIS